MKYLKPMVCRTISRTEVSRMKRKVNAAFRMIWDEQDVSEFWDVPKDVVRRGATIGAIPSFKIGGKLRFHQAEIVDFGR